MTNIAPHCSYEHSTLLGSSVLTAGLADCWSDVYILCCVMSKTVVSVLPGMQAAGEAFSILFKGGAGGAVESIIPTLLMGLDGSPKQASQVRVLFRNLRYLQWPRDVNYL